MKQEDPRSMTLTSHLRHVSCQSLLVQQVLRHSRVGQGRQQRAGRSTDLRLHDLDQPLAQSICKQSISCSTAPLTRCIINRVSINQSIGSQSINRSIDQSINASV